MEKKKKERCENILNVPTFLNISRIILTFVIVYMIIIESRITYIVIVFGIAAITDWFDGFIARKYNLVNDFGAKADMLADRFLWVGTALTFVVVFGIKGELNVIHGVQALLIMIREIIALPFALAAFFNGELFPPARYVAKMTTFAQGFALPALMLSVFYPLFIYASFPLAVFIGVIGTISGLYYIEDVSRTFEKNQRYAVLEHTQDAKLQNDKHLDVAKLREKKQGEKK